MMARQRYNNRPEQECLEGLRERGFEPHKRGWPDFWWVEDGELCAVEVKPRKNSHLKRDQKACMSALAAAGVKVFRFDPSSGMERLLPGDPRLEHTEEDEERARAYRAQWAKRGK